jgi:hypothetical protein
VGVLIGEKLRMLLKDLNVFQKEKNYSPDDIPNKYIILFLIATNIF